MAEVQVNKADDEQDADFIRSILRSCALQSATVMTSNRQAYPACMRHHAPGLTSGGLRCFCSALSCKYSLQRHQIRRATYLSGRYT